MAHGDMAFLFRAHHEASLAVHAAAAIVCLGVEGEQAIMIHGDNPPNPGSVRGLECGYDGSVTLMSFGDC